MILQSLPHINELEFFRMKAGATRAAADSVVSGLDVRRGM